MIEELEGRLVPSTCYVDNTNPNSSDTGRKFGHPVPGAEHVRWARPVVPI